MTSLVRLNAVGVKDKSVLTISSGEVTATQGFHAIAAESSTSDDLDTITVGFQTTEVNSITYRPIICITADTGDTITLKHGTGNIDLPDDTDIAVTDDMFVWLLYDGTNWITLKAVAAGTAVTGASNVGSGGVGVFKQLSGSTLQFKNIIAGSGAITVTDDTPDDEIEIDIGSISASSIGSGTLAHERGGLEADVSAYNGFVVISGGSTSSKGVPSGDVVGTTDIQTLVNKTFTTPTLNQPVISTFASAQHGHEDAAGGGTLDAAAIASGTLNNSRVNWAAPGDIGTTTPGEGRFDDFSVRVGAGSDAEVNLYANGSGTATAFIRSTDTGGFVVQNNGSASILIISQDVLQLRSGGSAALICDASQNTRVTGALKIDGALNHDGSTVGFMGATPQGQWNYTVTGAGRTNTLDVASPVLQNVANFVAQMADKLAGFGLFV